MNFEFQGRFYHYLVEQVNSELKGGELNMMLNLRGDQLTMTSTQAPTNDPNTASMSAHLVPGFLKTNTAKIAN